MIRCWVQRVHDDYGYAAVLQDGPFLGGGAGLLHLTFCSMALSCMSLPAASFVWPLAISEALS
jgi:hypothetical protein